ncbi:SOUL family heme-binding protein [Hyphobacterium sp.]|uniref:SOUL family heme-binding protein n=1 Tax=Hyphobacterium sp. TaxID=2004662 RepID=UPI003BAD6751
MRLIVGLLALMFSPAAAMATEEPAYESVHRDGAIEVRDYAGMIVAEVTVEGGREAAPNRGFRPLANYIFGGNAPREEIAMTAPVTARPGQDIAMTAPVTSSPAAGDQWTVAFIMPSEWTMETLPEPNDPRVSLREVEPRRMVAIEFRGGRSDNNLSRHLQELESWLAANGYEATGDPVYAFYSPPWVPSPLRRNEIMIEIAPRN